MILFLFFLFDHWLSRLFLLFILNKDDLILNFLYFVLLYIF